MPAQNFRLIFPIPMRYPSRPEATRPTPITAVAEAQRMSMAEPWNTKAGAKTKKKGMKYLTTPSFMDCNAVRMGSAPAIPAAVKAPMATGGVM